MISEKNLYRLSWLFTSLFVLSAEIGKNIPKVRILVLSQLSGPSMSASSLMDSIRMVSMWKSHLDERMSTELSWPFNATIEVMDTKSDAKYTAKLLEGRVKDKSLPPITIITGPETKSLLKPVAAFSSKYKIPFVSFNSGQLQYPRLSIYNNSFFVNPQNVFQYIEVVNSYVDLGVKSLVAVAMPTLESVGISYNPETCFGAANLAATKGISVLDSISLNFNMTSSDIKTVIESIRDNHKPDAILWCDQYSNIFPYVSRYNPMPMFKEANYLPKILTLIDALDAPSLQAYKDDGLLMYVTGGTFVCDRVTGPDYTEDNVPYSSMFRYKKTINNVYDEINFGSTVDMPSSTQLFYKWYRNLTGTSPQRRTITLWATFDVIEAALYRATQVPGNLDDQFLSSLEVLDALRYMRLSTPGGPIDFGTTGDNKAFNTLVVQALSTVGSADIVYPGSVRTGHIVYPMPTWDERVYTWRLLSDRYVMISIFVAGLCSILIATIAVTVIVHRTDQPIRMIHYLHILAICVTALLSIWSLVLIWQRDNNITQCRSFLWTTFLPASFFVQLVNMKANRLSLFVIASATGKRPKPFSHMKVLRITCCLLLFTVAVLSVITALDPPVRTKVVYDIHRQKLDEYQCRVGVLGQSLLYILVIFHVGISMLCVMAVRNGMEEFQDGLIFKEAFMILYACLLISFVMDNLQLTSTLTYALRSVIMNVGITTFLLRLFISRCIPYWIPEFIRVRYSKFYVAYINPIVRVLNFNSSHAAGVSSILSGSYGQGDGSYDEDGPVYVKEIPEQHNIDDMLMALRDPQKRNIFKNVAKKALCSENLDFIFKVIEFESLVNEELIKHSCLASDALKTRANQIFMDHFLDKSELEINVSAATKHTVEKRLKEWVLNQPFLSSEECTRIADIDYTKRKQLFAPAFNEICIMTYQNLWNKYRTAETQYLACGGDEFSVKYSEISDDTVVELKGYTKG